MWVRIDDRLHSHPKFLRAWALSRPSVGLELFALSHSAAYLTDGAVDPLLVDSLFQSRRQRDQAVAALVATGLWTPNGDGWQIHDFLEYNDSREQIEARRAADSARKRHGVRRVSG